MFSVQVPYLSAQASYQLDMASNLRVKLEPLDLISQESSGQGDGVIVPDTSQRGTAGGRYFINPAAACRSPLAVQSPSRDR